MTSEKFVAGVREAIIVSNFDRYKNIFSNPVLEEWVEPDFKSVLNFCRTLNAEQKNNLFKIIRQVQLDTLACFFSMLDGDLELPNQKGDFKLTIDGENDAINENLVDTLYEIEQREEYEHLNQKK